jgi:hypothetical protein
MTARPDISDSNVRIEDIANLKLRHPKTTGGGMVAQSTAVAPVQHFNNVAFIGGPSRGKKTSAGGGMQKASEGEAEDWMDANFEDPAHGALDRSTIKSISRLIYERDTSKLTPTKHSHPSSPRSLPPKSYRL